jgi:hypothetical protein
MTTYEITLAVAITILNVIVIGACILYRTKQYTIPSCKTQPLSQIQQDTMYIQKIINVTNFLPSEEDRLKNIQKVYEYLVIHPSLLVRDPTLRAIISKKAAEAQALLSRKPYYSCAAELSHVLEAYYATLQAISILPSYVK